MAVQAHIYPENLVYDLDSGYCFHDPQHALFFQNQNRGISSASCSSSSSTGNHFPSVEIPQSLEAEIQMQKQEIDLFLQLQNEKLRSDLQEIRMQHFSILLKNMESKAMLLIKQKEDDIAQLVRTSVELEACLSRTEAETEWWKRSAFFNEAMVIDLSKKLQEVRERLASAEDAESCFSCHEVEPRSMACKNCNSERKCVLFLPCRHVCCCKRCEAFLGCCPVCKSVKEATMEVFFV